MLKRKWRQVRPCSFLVSLSNLPGEAARQAETSSQTKGGTAPTSLSSDLQRISTCVHVCTYTHVCTTPRNTSTNPHIPPSHSMFSVGFTGVCARKCPLNTHAPGLSFCSLLTRKQIKQGKETTGETKREKEEKMRCYVLLSKVARLPD